MYMLMFILDDPNYLDEVLDAWEEVGVSGVTIVESTGMARIQNCWSNLFTRTTLCG